MDFYYDSQNLKYKTPFGACVCGTEVSFYFDKPQGCSVSLCAEFSIGGFEKIMLSPEGFAVLKLPEKGCLMKYWFEISCPDGSHAYYGNNPEGLGGEGCLYSDDPKAYQLTVYEPSYAPDWLKDCVMYQIFPDRFARDDDNLGEDWYKTPKYRQDENGDILWDFYGGTLKGIERKLSYLKSLGVSCIYLNPIFKASSNHRYDTDDFFMIDERLGKNEDFRLLAESADKLCIKIILDGVFNHAGKNSRYLKEHPDWFTGGHWWDFKDLFDFDKNNPEYAELICGENGVVRHWIKEGAAGFRLDVADELPDEFIKKIRAASKTENKDAALIGEVWEDASNKISYGRLRCYFTDDELDGVMGYPFRSFFMDFFNWTIDSHVLTARLMNLIENYPKDKLLCNLNICGSHDTVRALNELGADYSEHMARERLKSFASLQFAMPGIPCIYYGDEAGLRGGKDPENRAAYPWGRQDGDILYRYKLLGQIYAEYPQLKNGDFRPVDLGDDIFAFYRDNILVAVNRRDYPVSLSTDTNGAYALELFSSEEKYISDGKLYFGIPEYGCVFILIKDTAPLSLKLKRSAGVLAHISSVPGGTLGKPAEDFIDFLSGAGFEYWQMLPLNPVGDAGSPYLSPDSFSLEQSYAEEGFSSEEQLLSLREYAGSKGIKLIGDIPFYVAREGADFDNYPQIFGKNGDRNAADAGVPPDALGPEGQNWNCRIYDWNYLKNTGYDWWIRRIEYNLRFFDLLRIDHFRGLSAYFCIPKGMDARVGYWEKGPGADFFYELRRRLVEDGFIKEDDPLPIIAEDLGTLDNQVFNLIKLSGVPGMNVFQFESSKMLEMTKKEAENRIFYSGTHDNDTLLGWEQKNGRTAEDLDKDIEALYASNSPLVMLQLQDVLSLDSSARMNVPGTTENNWRWKADKSMLSEGISAKFRFLSEKYGRSRR